MSTFEDFKQQWSKNSGNLSGQENTDREAMNKIIRARTKKQKNIAMQYFWASFTLQLIVYGMLSHVAIKYGSDAQILMYCATAALLFIPFTIVLMRKFKQIAVNRPDRNATDEATVYKYILRQYNLLKSFYHFKQVYEIILIPTSTAIGTILLFQLYVPGGVRAHEAVVIIAFSITVVSCMFAIHTENRKHFREPLQRLHEILGEFEDETIGGSAKAQ